MLTVLPLSLQYQWLLFPAQFQKLFADEVKDLGEDDFSSKPFSLPAAQYVQKTGSLSSATVRGRWARKKTARLDINERLSAYTSIALAHSQMSLVSTLCHKILERLSVSPGGLAI